MYEETYPLEINVTFFYSGIKTFHSNISIEMTVMHIWYALCYCCFYEAVCTVRYSLLEPYTGKRYDIGICTGLYIIRIMEHVRCAKVENRRL